MNLLQVGSWCCAAAGAVYVRARSTPVLVHNRGSYLTGYADSCTCEGVGEITYQGIDEATCGADATGSLTSRAIQRLRQRVSRTRTSSGSGQGNVLLLPRRPAQSGRPRSRAQGVRRQTIDGT